MAKINKNISLYLHTEYRVDICFPNKFSYQYNWRWSLPNSVTVRQNNLAKCSGLEQNVEKSIEREYVNLSFMLYVFLTVFSVSSCFLFFPPESYNVVLIWKE